MFFEISSETQARVGRSSGVGILHPDHLDGCIFGAGRLWEGGAAEATERACFGKVGRLRISYAIQPPIGSREELINCSARILFRFR